MVNDMNSSLESLYSSCSIHTETTPLLHQGHAPHHGHRLHHSQPVHITAVRRLQEQQCRPSSLPAVINPFPELCTPPGSPEGLSVLLPPPPPHSPFPSLILSPLPTHPLFCLYPNICSVSMSPVSYLHLSPSLSSSIIKVCSEDGAGKVVEVPADMRARDVCQLLVYKSHCLDDNCWSLVEHHPLLGLERCLEDHELVVQVHASMTSDSKFLFRKNYAKYEFFRNPLNFFPDQMVTWCQESNGSIPQSQLLQEPRHLQLLSDLEDCNIYTVTTGRKSHNAPTDYQFCIKPSKVRNDCKELRMLCAEDEQSRTCWMTAFRLLKYGILLYQNYKSPQQRKSPLSHFSTPVRSVSENSLVAMDFSGRTGRVIENPLEAQSAALEEGQTWRKRGQRMNALGSPLHPSSVSSVIHRTQLWFHGRIMRDEAHKMVMQQGQVDGLFLLRDSQSNPRAFVLTLCHHQKIRHFQILPYEEDGQMFFSLDEGSTKFTDLIHLVEFYQLNRGVLPCRLKHPCTAVAL
uniref:Growth factor receptor-bound protein 10a n=1 Tax=Esox lucius TaxID=8010 RepID=A0AAY5KVZ6_ESOLU